MKTGTSLPKEKPKEKKLQSRRITWTKKTKRRGMRRKDSRKNWSQLFIVKTTAEIRRKRQSKRDESLDNKGKHLRTKDR